jgi:ParB family chromosome partitioning protein
VQVEIASIRSRNRIRHQVEDIETLAESMNRLGQLHPVLLTRRKILVAGKRRMEAAKLLGWTTIEANVVGQADALKLLEIELEENVQRLPLSQEELGKALTRLEVLRHPGFFRRIWNAIVAFVQSIFL